ncbi:hypothetical protein HW115_18600 [Verrucomicrobiaceae bacterium N1E253]|uniref:Uncharacterized protein n=1 Tax=Oceaniferula marina TaxID=2748318 RepID=A0A851GTK8_9BACT|nr:hypothetical protein [Oceaniferula marina]NWK57634.1 hypothetical protein [Oceaniferula marina]
MKTSIITLVSMFLMVATLIGGLPKIEKLKTSDELVVTVTYTEPAISSCIYSFSGKQVVIKDRGKQLGRLVLTEDDIVKVDTYLDTVHRGKKASRSDLGGPIYSITHLKSGRKVGTWSYSIREPRKSSKPSLSLFALKKRLENK